MTIGFSKPLYILPFDHRGSFQKKMFGWDECTETEEIAAAKRVIYDAFRSAVRVGCRSKGGNSCRGNSSGSAILRDAAAEGTYTCCPAEKSGQDEFDFEYGQHFADHINAFGPTFCKVLVRYNPEVISNSTGFRRLV